MDDFEEQYATVMRWSKPIHHVAGILNPSIDKRSETVRFHMQHLLDWVEQTYTSKDDLPMVANLKSYSRGFWKGLFTCYDHPHVPRTNNDHERFFRQTKTRHRRMTGLRSWNEYILRSGEMVVFVDDALHQSNVLSRLQSVNYLDFKNERLRWSARLSEATKRRRFRTNTSVYLEQAENAYCMLIGQS
ncbi:transposase [Brevibacillus brevis]|uniref:Transposase n=1 Tax=Brevibacillus brevis TaxID=1393 RepID=A0ABY9TAS6_BREBE|nr:transposase [Brevibacillus brevis]WNC12574.1 transposase [Brevibacillus brevis]WNC16266.1 transposase [Brevibacillus brevis]